METIGFLVLFCLIYSIMLYKHERAQKKPVMIELQLTADAEAVGEKLMKDTGSRSWSELVTRAVHFMLWYIRLYRKGYRPHFYNDKGEVMKVESPIKL